MAAGIEAFFYHPTKSAGFWDAVSGRFIAPSSGTPNVVATREGLAQYLSNGATVRSTLTARNPLAKQTQDVTILCRYRMKSLPSNKCNVFLYSNTAQSRGIVVGATSTLAHGWAMTGSNGLIFGGGTSSSDLDVFRTIGVEHHETLDARVYAWLDGVPQGSFVCSGASIGIALTTLAIGRDASSYYQTPDVEILWAVAFNRRLTDAEHAWWHRNAFDVLEGRQVERRSISVASGGAQTLTPSLFTNTQTFYGPTVSATYSLTPTLVTNSQTFFAPTVSATYSLTPALFTNTQTFFAPTVTPGAVTLTPALVTNSQTFFGPTVSQGDVLSPSLVTNSQTFYGPTVTAGAVTLLPALIANTSTFFGATVSGGEQASSGGGGYLRNKRKTREERAAEWRITLRRLMEQPEPAPVTPEQIELVEPAVEQTPVIPVTPLSPAERMALLEHYGLAPQPIEPIPALPVVAPVVSGVNKEAIIALLLAAA